MWSLLREAINADEEMRLQAIAVPTLVVSEVHDPVCGAAWVEQITRLLPEGRLVTVPGARHGVPYSRPGALAAQVSLFIAQQSAAWRLSS